MHREKDIITRELILLKLAQWTNSFRFINDTIKSPFAKVLCYAVYEACASLPVWPEFINTLDIKNGTSSAMNKNGAKQYAKRVKKRFPVEKRLFAPRITYKYLLIAEVCYIHAAVKKTVNPKLIDELCAWLSIAKSGKLAIMQYVEKHFDPRWMMQVKNIKKEKGVLETIPPFSEFVEKETKYYQLPRKNVSVFSTMSSGKSTFVNALLGHDYLPTKNEACTAKVASISDIDHIDYCLGYAVKNGEFVFCGHVNQNKMIEWNSDSKISAVTLEGNLDRISGKNVVMVIHDTPGVNYSGNREHKKITLEHIVDSRPDVIICLLDATQMHTTDFSGSIEDLKKANTKGSNGKILFVINKADCYDPKKESVRKMIEDTLVELEKFGFKNPSVIPVSARAARLFKMALHGRTYFTENEIDDFVRYIRFFTRPENNFNLLGAGIPGEAAQDIQYASSGKDDIVIEGISYEREQITKALFNTGIPVVENILNDHKEKLNDRNNLKV
jgi:GTPase Era involved in 16S rRNA processing